MSFQFVNTTAKKRKPDEKTRRKIRSQVMKDYRRRRDEDHSTPGPSTLDSGRQSPGPSVERTVSGSRPQSPAELATPPGEVLGERSAKRGRPDKTQRLQAASLFLQTTHGLFANFTVDLPKRKVPEATQKTDDGERSRMLEICAKYHEWLGRADPNLPAIAAAQDSLESSMQFYAATMNAIGHLHAIGVFKGGDERAYYKTRLLSIANTLLHDPSKALEDSTLTALAGLASYEISFNSHEALTHLIGISRIIASRGGLDALGDLGVMLQNLDLSHALYFNTESVFTNTTAVDSRRDGRRASSASVDESAAAEDEVRRWQDTLREASSFLREHDSAEASRACYLAWRVHLFQPRAGETWTSQSSSQMEELFHAMTSMPPDTWEQYPALHARVLLTSLATAVKAAHKSWYYTQLSRLMLHTEAQYWEDLKALVSGFIQCQACFRQAGMETVTAVVSGVEIEVERSLAEQMGLQIL